MNSSEKVALVTGGARGIGAAIVRQLAAEGISVAFTYSKSTEQAEALAASVSGASGVACLAIRADVRKMEEVAAAVDQIKAAHDRIDILVNNAGIVRDWPLITLEESDWHDVVDTNLSGAFNACKRIVPLMLRQRSGVIVNISSVAGLVGVPGQINYSATKAGLIGMTRSLARECASRNIRVNAVAPGFIRTEMTEGLSDSLKEASLERIPLKRFGEAKDVAALTCFLVSDAASYITGGVFVVDGGLTA